eukprot:410423-Rhodomonas_salina.1
MPTRQCVKVAFRSGGVFAGGHGGRYWRVTFRCIRVKGKEARERGPGVARKRGKTIKNKK